MEIHLSISEFYVLYFVQFLFHFRPFVFPFFFFITEIEEKYHVNIIRKLFLLLLAINVELSGKIMHQAIPKPDVF